jgi:hypothetical protein
VSGDELRTDLQSGLKDRSIELKVWPTTLRPSKGLIPLVGWAIYELIKRLLLISINHLKGDAFWSYSPNDLRLNQMMLRMVMSLTDDHNLCLSQTIKISRRQIGTH